MRSPEVFVRPLSPAEGQRLKRLSKRAEHASTRQRASILLASNTLMSVPQIARMWMTDESRVRRVIHEFNERGFAWLLPRFRGGRPRRISSDDEQRIVAIAGARPCPKHGRGWAPRGRPERHRATYTRRQGIRYLVGALDVHADHLRIRPRPRRDGHSTLTFVRQIRLAYPKRRRIYWIQDGLSCHWTPEIRSYADANNIELVPTPTYASFLNRIESTFGAIDEFVCKNADYLDWDAFGYALAEHVRHRNSPAECERRNLEAAKRRDRRAARTTRELKLAA